MQRAGHRQMAGPLFFVARPALEILSELQPQYVITSKIRILQGQVEV